MYCMYGHCGAPEAILREKNLTLLYTSSSVESEAFALVSTGSFPLDIVALRIPIEGHALAWKQRAICVACFAENTTQATRSRHERHVF